MTTYGYNDNKEKLLFCGKANENSELFVKINKDGYVCVMEKPFLTRKKIKTEKNSNSNDSETSSSADNTAEKFSVISETEVIKDDTKNNNSMITCQVPENKTPDISQGTPEIKSDKSDNSKKEKKRNDFTLNIPNFKCDDYDKGKKLKINSCRKKEGKNFKGKKNLIQPSACCFEPLMEPFMQCCNFCIRDCSEFCPFCRIQNCSSCCECLSSCLSKCFSNCLSDCLKCFTCKCFSCEHSKTTLTESLINACCKLDCEDCEKCTDCNIFNCNYCEGLTCENLNCEGCDFDGCDGLDCKGLDCKGC